MLGCLQCTEPARARRSDSSRTSASADHNSLCNESNVALQAGTSGDARPAPNSAPDTRTQGQTSLLRIDFHCFSVWALSPSQCIHGMHMQCIHGMHMHTPTSIAQVYKSDATRERRSFSCSAARRTLEACTRGMRQTTRPPRRPHKPPPMHPPAALAVVEPITLELLLMDFVHELPHLKNTGAIAHVLIGDCLLHGGCQRRLRGGKCRRVSCAEHSGKRRCVCLSDERGQKIPSHDDNTAKGSHLTMTTWPKDPPSHDDNKAKGSHLTMTTGQPSPRTL